MDYFITTLYTCTNHSQWQEGLLLQLLQTSRGGGAVTGSSGDEGGRGGRWIVLDGALSAFQLDTLLTLFDVDKLIKLSNGRGIPIDSSCRFILEVCMYIHIHVVVAVHSQDSTRLACANSVCVCV